MNASLEDPRRREGVRFVAQLTVETVDQVLDVLVTQHVNELDLRHVTYIDPYALLLLVLGIRHCLEEGVALAIQWPQRPAVYRWMNAAGFFAQVEGPTPAPSTGSWRTSDALQPITPITEEQEVSRLVEAFDHRLAQRYPLTTTSRNALVRIMIELFQNIPQHSNATGKIVDPCGLAAMQDYADSIFLAVADKGVGLRGSLSLRAEFAGLSDKRALDAIVFEGISRFADPGRGGELLRIARLIRNWDGMLAIRSGEACLIADAERGDVYDAPAFPGVQIAVRLPRQVFGIDAPPIDREAFTEFNEQNA